MKHLQAIENFVSNHSIEESLDYIAGYFPAA